MSLTDALLLALVCEFAIVIIILLAHRRRHRAHSASLEFIDNQGKEIKMPATLTVGQTATAVLHEWTGTTPGTGTEVKPIGPVSYSSDNPAAATVDSASGLVTAVAVGSANITGSDAGNSLSAVDSVTVNAPVAQSASLVITPN
jgi:hypothetical protein